MKKSDSAGIDINSSFSLKIKLKDRIKLLFSGTITAICITTVKQKPEVIKSNLTLKF